MRGLPPQWLDIDRGIRDDKTANFRDDLFSTKLQQRNATQTQENGTKVSPSRVTQPVTCPSFGGNKCIFPMIMLGLHRRHYCDANAGKFRFQLAVFRLN